MNQHFLKKDKHLNYFQPSDQKTILPLLSVLVLTKCLVISHYSEIDCMSNSY